MAVGIVWTPIAGIVLAVLTLIFIALLEAGMPATAGGHSVDPYLAQVMRWNLARPPRPQGTLGLTSVADALRRIFLVLHVWIFAAGAILLVGLASLYGFHAVGGRISSLWLYATAVVLITAFTPLLISASLAEVSGKQLTPASFVPRQGWTVATVCSFISVMWPFAVAYLVLDAYSSLSDVSIAWEQRGFSGSSTVLVVVGVIATIAGAVAYVPLRWSAYFAIHYGMPIGGCIVESIRMARVQRGHQLLGAAPVAVVIVLPILLGRALDGSAQSWMLLYVGLAGTPVGLALLSLAGSIDFTKLSGREPAPAHRPRHPVVYPVISGPNPVHPPTIPGIAAPTLPPIHGLSPTPPVRVAHSRPAPRGSLLATAALILYPALTTAAIHVYDQVQTETTGFATSLSPGDARLFLLGVLFLTAVPNVLAVMAVVRSRRDIWVPQAWVRFLAMLAILAQIGGVVGQAITAQSLNAADAGPYLFVTDLVTVSALLAAWLLGHRRARATAWLAVVSGFLCALIIAHLNQQLGELGNQSPERFVELSTTYTAFHLTAVSAMYATTAWIAYIIELIALRNKAPQHHDGSPYAGPRR
ncbi:hypothetical protein EF294_02520 [Gordonia oryzae]|uniref:Uncharacterized protein n=1 Tax=Gordonia oryzae TaxID=2487349 RepID=A0A3N4GRP9_9ACTN|nr:hypothetical protein [Gordonia oryzae]RPA65649.1 hypothetical protein EF294_02520 [Gordonia oryzae]